MKELQPEGGITQISLSNVRLLAVVHGPVRFLIHFAPAGTTVEDETVFLFQDGYSHVASGFSCGYAGEGPRGLCEIIEEKLDRRDIKMEHIACWRGSVYFVLRGEGSGQAIQTVENVFLFGKKFSEIEIW